MRTVAVMLAYVFWHWPAVETNYEPALLAFHRALADHPPAGFRGLRTFRVGGHPWLPVPRAYEDWYFVEDFAALGALNDAAISGPRQSVHDAIAALPAGGVASLYGLVSERIERPRYAAFRSKPAGTPYPAYVAGLPRNAEAWQRKMVLGPSPEFCLCSVDALEDSRSLDPIVERR